MAHLIFQGRVVRPPERPSIFSSIREASRSRTL
jgi:hypothetical protein